MNSSFITGDDPLREYSYVRKPMVNVQLAQLVLAAIGVVIVLVSCHLHKDLNTAMKTSRTSHELTISRLRVWLSTLLLHSSHCPSQ